MAPPLPLGAAALLPTAGPWHRLPLTPGAAPSPQTPALPPRLKAEGAAISAEWLVCDALDPCPFCSLSPTSALQAARASPRPSPALCVTGTVALLQVEDITASHEAALLEMENSHTEAIATLQGDHDHKVQGSYQPGRVRPAAVGHAGQPRSRPRAPVVLVGGTRRF